jgi:hypothetical protein
MSEEFDGEDFGYLIQSKKNEVDEFMFQTAFYEILHSLKNSKDIVIIDYLYKGFTVADISRISGYTRAYIHQRIRKLRNQPFGRELNALLKQYIAEKTG